MGYIFDFNDAASYEKWLNDPCNRFEVELESRLLFDILKPFMGKRVLDIGCGTGFFLSKLIQKGLNATGIDPSPYMLDIASEKLKNRVDLHRGFAESLPFEDNSFDYSTIITTLEFVKDPEKALEEAFRVTKDRIFIGVLNRYALKGIKRRIKGIFTETIYNHARFFSVLELKGMIKKLLGDVPVSWGTVCQFPASSGRIMSRIEQNSIVQKCPFGAFVGMGVTLIPRFRTKPLSITSPARHRTIGTAAG